MKGKGNQRAIFHVNVNITQKPCDLPSPSLSSLVNSGNMKYDILTAWLMTPCLYIRIFRWRIYSFSWWLKCILEDIFVQGIGLVRAGPCFYSRPCCRAVLKFREIFFLQRDKTLGGANEPVRDWKENILAFIS